MTLDLADFDSKARDAIKAFWGNRQKARQKQIEAGKIDAGERSGVTAGKNLDGFIALILDLVEANGLSREDVHRSGVEPWSHCRGISGPPRSGT